ncbi:hypothetical protein UT300002_30100 [Clostridium perfringens]
MNYQKIVQSVENKGITKLIFIPVFIGFIVYFLPGVLQPLFGSILGSGVTEAGLIASIIAMVITIIFATILMTKVGGFKLKTLGIEKRQCIKNSSVGAIGGVIV